jgi:alkanesulfonate monooxygenase SsuD/methylene tetrahydromethanopterin reductase-like flavin-dependent oxidoreductase (luciferase family)
MASRSRGAARLLGGKENTMKVGLVVMDENPADALRIVRAADRAGVHSLWTIDYYNRSSLTRAAAFAAVSGDAIVGTSITPLFACPTA